MMLLFPAKTVLRYRWKIISLCCKSPRLIFSILGQMLDLGKVNRCRCWCCWCWWSNLPCWGRLQVSPQNFAFSPLLQFEEKLIFGSKSAEFLLSSLLFFCRHGGHKGCHGGRHGDRRGRRAGHRGCHRGRRGRHKYIVYCKAYFGEIWAKREICYEILNLKLVI